jgi:hypothetical protein
MLEHVWECKALSEQIIWCFKCWRPEVFPDFGSKPSLWNGIILLGRRNGSIRKLKKEVGFKLYSSCADGTDRRPTSVEGFEALWNVMK